MVEAMMKELIDGNQEGLMLKSAEGLYEPGKRRWFKVGGGWAEGRRRVGGGWVEGGRRVGGGWAEGGCRLSGVWVEGGRRVGGGWGVEGGWRLGAG
jgi:hypothetical protein